MDGYQADAAEQAARRATGERPACPQRHLLGPTIRRTGARPARDTSRLHRSSRITLRFIRAMLGRSGYSTWAPEALTRSPQLATSLLTNASAASAESPGSSPLRLRFSVALGLSVIALIALFSAATTLAGVPFGTQNPTQDEPSAPGYPSSARLGQFGRSG